VSNVGFTGTGLVKCSTLTFIVNQEVLTFWMINVRPFVASEVIPDPKGRYVIVTGKQFSTLLVLASVYDPIGMIQVYFLPFYLLYPI
jgi:hypothetical protein